jgi:hypothetical protein
MKKWRQKSGCAASFGNTVVKIAASNRASPLPRIALYHYWKANFTVPSSVSELWLSRIGMLAMPILSKRF